MKNEFDIENFERFLQQEVNDHKLYPSDAVWNNVSKQIQTKKSWPALSIIAFLIISSLTVATLLNYPPENILAKLQYQDSVYKQKQIQQQISQQEHIHDKLSNRTSIAEITAKTFAEFKQQQNLVQNQNAIQVIDLDIKNEEIKSENEIELISDTRKQTIQSTVKVDIEKSKTTFSSSSVQDDNSVFASNETQTTNINTSVEKKADLRLDTLFIHEKDLLQNNQLDFSEFSELFSNSTTLNKSKSAYKKRWSYQIYATPSVSYRKLEDDKQRNNFSRNAPNAPLAPNVTNSVNTLVRHKPALGTEFGFGVIYAASSRIQIRTGLQFNVRQYYIDAFKSYGVATIAIIQNNRLDSVNVFTGYGNNTGNSETMLDNKLYQISIPVGVELQLLRGKRLGINAGVSIQPTLTLNKNAYIISTDYKYYADAEPFFRQFNINTSADLNISYQFKHKKIYIGPQIRYQHLPTYNDIYPIKEYRWDYGVRIGIIQPF
ncbi:MAG: hypothetical protein ACOVNY_07440 [Chitinophagaceae bacterium]